MVSERDSHEFIVTDVELADSAKTDGVGVVLTDARGGKVRLNLTFDMAERLRERVAFALERSEGP
jgi:hypothetical protein